MTLVNIWTRDFSQHIARTVATIEQHQIQLPAVRDAAGTVVRASETTDGLVLTITGLTPEFQDKLVHGLLHGVMTIENQAAFAFIYAQARWDNGTMHVVAVPYVTYLRRNALPDWYVPDERFC